MRASIMPGGGATFHLLWPMNSQCRRFNVLARQCPRARSRGFFQYSERAEFTSISFIIGLIGLHEGRAEANNNAEVCQLLKN